MKQEIDAILHSILQHDPADLYWSGDFLRWGAVQRDLHAVAAEYEARIAHLQAGYMAELNVVEQALGAALGYSRYCDNPEIFPDATEADGVCVGIHAAGTLAMEAADVIKSLKARIAELEHGK